MSQRLSDLVGTVHCSNFNLFICIYIYLFFKMQLFFGFMCLLAVALGFARMNFGFYNSYNNSTLNDRHVVFRTFLDNSVTHDFCVKLLSQPTQRNSWKTVFCNIFINAFPQLVIDHSVNSLSRYIDLCLWSYIQRKNHNFVRSRSSWDKHSNKLFSFLILI